MFVWLWCMLRLCGCVVNVVSVDEFVCLCGCGVCCVSVCVVVVYVV